MMQASNFVHNFSIEQLFKMSGWPPQNFAMATIFQDGRHPGSNLGLTCIWSCFGAFILVLHAQGLLNKHK